MRQLPLSLDLGREKPKLQPGKILWSDNIPENASVSEFPYLGLD